MSFRIPLHLLLILPFVLEVVGAVGVTGWLSFRNGQKAVNQLAGQLREESTEQTKLQISDLLTTATEISELTAKTIQDEQIDLTTIRSLEDLYWRQLSTFETFNGLGVGNAEGDLMGLFRQTHDVNATVSYYLEYTDKDAEESYISLELDAKRQVIQENTFERQIDARQRLWYQAAAAAKQPVWTDIYPSISKSTTHALLVNFSRPIFDENQTLQGVISVILDLGQISQFLNELQLSPSGQAYIIQPTGELIGASDSQVPINLDDGVVNRLNAINSQTLLIRESAAYLKQHFANDLTSIRQSQQLEFFLDGKRQFLQVSPVSEESDLDWLVVVVMPESDFMTQIRASTRNTIFLCMAALGIALILGIATSHWITQPIYRLNRAATRLSKGNFSQQTADDQIDHQHRVKEVRSLAQSFKQMEQNLQHLFVALQGSESRLRMALEAAEIVCWEYGLETGQIHCSGKYAQHGWEATTWQTTAEDLFVEIHPDDRLQLQSAISTAIEHGGELNLEHRMMLSNQDIIWVLMLGQVLVTEMGKPDRVVGVWLNISDRKQAEQQLQQQQQFLHTVIDAVPNLIFVKDWEGHYVLANQAAAAFYNKPVETLIGKSDADFNPDPEEVARFVQENQRVIQSGRPLFVPEEQVSMAPGAGEWLQWQKHPLRVPGVDTPCVLGVGVNITARKQAEESLRQERNLLSQIMETSPAGIVVLNPAGRITFANVRAEQLLGLVKDDVIGRTYNAPEWRIQHLDGSPFPEAKLPFNQVMQTGQPVFDVQHAIEWPDGKQVLLSVNGAPLINSGLIESVVFTIEDITERRRSEQEREQLLADAIAARTEATNTRDLLTSVFERMHDGIVALDTEWRYTYINDKASELLGRPAAELVGKQIWTEFPEGIGQPFYHAYHRAVEQQTVVYLQEHYEPWNRWFENRIYPDANGLTIYFTEITDRKQAELQVEKVTQRLTLATDAAKLGVWEFNLVDNRLIWDSRMYQLYGFDSPKVSVTYETWQQRVHPDDLPAADNAVQATIAGEQDLHTEFRIILPDGQIRYLESHAVVLRDTVGVAQRMIGVNWDITERKHAEVERLQAEHVRKELTLLERILDVILAGYWDWDIPNQQEYLSPGFKKMFGYEDHELPNTPESWQTLIFPEDLPKVLDCFERHVQSRGEVPYYNEVRYRHKDGSTVWVICSGQVIEWDEAGNPLRMIGCHIDITERKRSEATLQTSEQRLQTLINILPFGVWVRDVDDRLVLQNTVDIDRFGDQIGSTPVNIPGVQGYSEAYNNLKKSCQLGHSVEYERKETVAGQERYFRRMTAPFPDLNGETGMFGIYIDITQQKHAELALRESEQRYATLAESSPVGIFRNDTTGRMIYANQRWSEITGLTLAEGSGNGWLTCVHPDWREHLVSEWENITQEGSHHWVETCLQLPDDTLKWVYYQAQPEKDSAGNVIGYVGTLTDITDLKHAEEQVRAAQQRVLAQEKLASLGTLTAGIAHELRNPLNFVKNYAEGSVELSQELLEAVQPVLQTLTSKASKYIQDLILDLQENSTTIRHHSQRVAQIVDSMMQYSRADYEQATSELSQLHDLIDQAIKLAYYGKRSYEHDFTLSIHTDYATDVTLVKAISSSLLRAFINLIDNACDAMLSKQRQLESNALSDAVNYKPTLSISTRNLGDQVEIRLRDNGCGIDSTIQSQILDPFFTTKPPGEGTGLGLSLTHDIIVKQHQGTLAIDTLLDEFTEFILTIPKNSG